MGFTFKLTDFMKMHPLQKIIESDILKIKKYIFHAFEFPLIERLFLLDVELTKNFFL